MPRDPLPFGAVLGEAPGGVASYSSDYDTVDRATFPDRHSFRSMQSGVYTGYKWQCVEFARRWCLSQLGWVFEDVPMAYDIFDLREVVRVPSGERLPLSAWVNGSRRRPEPGALLIWKEGGEFETTGHVAIVTAVSDDGVRIAEQNFDHRPWAEGADYSRELFARVGPDDSFWIRCNARGGQILGWMLQAEPDAEAQQEEPTPPERLALQLRTLQPAPPAGRAWLNLANEDEFAYVAMNGQRLCTLPGREAQYVAISDAAIEEVERATNVLHALFLHATDYVFQHPERLPAFNLPDILWPRLKQSWDNRRNQLISGRFDFVLSAQGLKVYEYNADSASCQMECGKVQGLWAQHAGLRDGEDPGAAVFADLVAAWKDNAMDGLVHIMLDHDQEESYHARYMQSAMAAAGLATRWIQGTQGLQWGDDGRVLDARGTPITQVWKTWAWETALDQMRLELQQGAGEAAMQRRDQPPRLMDVLLHPEVMVIEPLWTLIPSNKAILPILWELFPGHRYLLESAHTLTDSLRHSGYVSKPIAGRCGHNISVVDPDAQTLEETAGRFGAQESIYQALAPLPQAEGLSLQLCSFTAGGYYSGACIRADTSMIITKTSDVLPLRIMDDSDWSTG